MNNKTISKTLRVLVVEDSPVALELLVHVLEADPQIRVIGTARDGEEAVACVGRLKPDVITMDYHMPKVNGLDATRKIMETHPVPILIVSASVERDEVASAFRLLEAGAVAVVEKPAGAGHPEHQRSAEELVQTVKLMSEVKVVRRWPKRDATIPAAPVSGTLANKPTRTGIELVAIGASTGGPLVLKTILSSLAPNFRVPILLVQHIAAGFTDGFAKWLAQASNMPVHVATHSEQPRAGHAYVAPDGHHMTLGASGRIVLTDEPPENGHRPSVSCLFRSVAAALGPSAVGVLLTGMGRDGVDELKHLKEAGAVTIAQDQESSVVYGMPGEAVQRQAATYVLTPDGIAAALENLAR